MVDRLELHWHSGSGHEDIAGFCGVYPVARAHLDCRSGRWLWSASWLAGIDAGGATDTRGGTIAPAEKTAGGWAAMSGLQESAITTGDQRYRLGGSGPGQRPCRTGMIYRHFFCCGRQ